MDWHAGGPLAENLRVIVIYGVIGLACVAALALWVVALLDWRKRDFGVTEERDKWMLRLIYGGWIGAIIYWFDGRKKGKLPGEGGPQEGEAAESA